MDIQLDDVGIKFLQDQYLDPESPENIAVKEILTLRQALQDLSKYVRTADGMDEVHSLKIRGLLK